MEMITADIWEMISAADLAEKGHWPVAGGWTDQTACAVEAIRFIWREEQDWKNRNKK